MPPVGGVGPSAPELQEWAGVFSGARIHAGLSQVQLGDRTGRDHKTIHRWGTAASAPNVIDLLLLAAAIDVSLSDLVR